MNIDKVMLDCVPFGTIDSSDNWIPNATKAQFEPGATRLYWNDNIFSLVPKFQAIQGTDTEDSFLERLHAEQIAWMQYLPKLEEFESQRLVWEPLVRKNKFKVEESEGSMMKDGKFSSLSVHRGDISPPPVTLWQQYHYTVRQQVHSLTPDTAGHRAVSDEAYQSDQGDQYPRRLSANDGVSENSEQGVALELQPLEKNRAERKNFCQKGPETTGSSSEEFAQQNMDVGMKDVSLDITPLPSRTEPKWTEDDSIEIRNLSTREIVTRYAEHAALKWIGNITKDSVFIFAASILQETREIFTSNPDLSKRVLSLEDMKYIYTAKVVPLAAPHMTSRGVFVCSGCPIDVPHDEIRWWQLEPLIQHYYAKHIFSGQRKVDWKTEWPQVEPFHPPDTVEKLLQSGATKDIQKRTDNLDPGGTVTGPYGHSSMSAADADAFKNVPSGPRLSKPLKINWRERKLSAVIADCQEAWNELSSLANIPASVHVHFVVTKAARKYQSKFAESLPLEVFEQAVVSGQLQAVHDSQGIPCLKCRKLLKAGFIDKYRAHKLYSFIGLLQHFESFHMKAVKMPREPLDWTRDMIRLPHPNIIADLTDETHPLRQHLIDVFPWAFTKPNAKSKGSDIKHWDNRADGFQPRDRYSNGYSHPAKSYENHGRGMHKFEPPLGPRNAEYEGNRPSGRIWKDKSHSWKNSTKNGTGDRGSGEYPYPSRKHNKHSDRSDFNGVEQKLHHRSQDYPPKSSLAGYGSSQQEWEGPVHSRPTDSSSHAQRFDGASAAHHGQRNHAVYSGHRSRDGHYEESKSSGRASRCPSATDFMSNKEHPPTYPPPRGPAGSTSGTHQPSRHRARSRSPTGRVDPYRHRYPEADHPPPHDPRYPPPRYPYPPPPPFGYPPLGYRDPYVAAHYYMHVPPMALPGHPEHRRPHEYQRPRSPPNVMGYVPPLPPYAIPRPPKDYPQEYTDGYRYPSYRGPQEREDRP